MKTIRQTYLIKANVEDVWQALVNPKIIDKWGGGPAKMSDKENEKFELWGGDIHGLNTKVVKNKSLEQDWYSGSWKKPSKVSFTLISTKEGTKLILDHKNVPEEDFDDIDEGWKSYYLVPLKGLLEK